MDSLIILKISLMKGTHGKVERLYTYLFQFISILIEKYKAKIVLMLRLITFQFR